MCSLKHLLRLIHLKCDWNARLWKKNGVARSVSAIWWWVWTSDCYSAKAWIVLRLLNECRSHCVISWLRDYCVLQSKVLFTWTLRKEVDISNAYSNYWIGLHNCYLSTSITIAAAEAATAIVIIVVARKEAHCTISVWMKCAKYVLYFAWLFKFWH